MQTAFENTADNLRRTAENVTRLFFAAKTKQSVFYKNPFIYAPTAKKRYDNIAADNAAKYITRIEQDP